MRRASTVNAAAVFRHNIAASRGEDATLPPAQDATLAAGAALSFRSLVNSDGAEVSSVAVAAADGDSRLALLRSFLSDAAATFGGIPVDCMAPQSVHAAELLLHVVDDRFPGAVATGSQGEGCVSGRRWFGESGTIPRLAELLQSLIVREWTAASRLSSAAVAAPYGDARGAAQRGQCMTAWEREFSDALREVLEPLPLTSAPAARAQIQAPLSGCCQVRLLIGLLETTRYAFQVQHEVASLPNTASNLMPVVCAEVCSRVFQQTRQLLLKEKVWHAFRSSVVHTTVLTHLFLDAPLLQTTEQESNHTALQPSLPRVFLSQMIKDDQLAAIAFLDTYRKSFVRSQASITSASELLAWLDSIAVILNAYVVRLEQVGRGDCSTTLNGGDADVAQHVEQLLCRLTLFDSDELLSAALLEELRFASARGSPSVEPSADSIQRDDAEKEVAEAIGRVRPKRSLFGKTPSLQSTSGDDNARSEPASSFSASTVGRLTQELVQETAAGATGGGPQGVTTPHTAAPAASRFARRNASVSLSSSSATTTGTSGKQVSPQIVTKTNESPIVALLRRNGAAMLNQLRPAIQSTRFEVWTRHYGTYYRIETVAVLLADSVSALWTLLDESSSNWSDDRCGVVHHIATEFESLASSLLTCIADVYHDRSHSHNEKEGGKSLSITGRVRLRHVALGAQLLSGSRIAGWAVRGVAVQLRQGMLLLSRKNRKMLPPSNNDGDDGAVPLRLLQTYTLPCLAQAHHNGIRCWRWHEAASKVTLLLSVYKRDMDKVLVPSHDGERAVIPAWLQADYCAAVANLTAAVASSSCGAAGTDDTSVADAVALLTTSLDFLLQDSAALLAACRREFFEALFTVQHDPFNVLAGRCDEQNLIQLISRIRQAAEKAMRLWVAVAAHELRADLVQDDVGVPFPLSGNMDAHTTLCISVLETLTSLRGKVGTAFSLHQKRVMAKGSASGSSSETPWTMQWTDAAMHMARHCAWAVALDTDYGGASCAGVDVIRDAPIHDVWASIDAELQSLAVSTISRSCLAIHGGKPLSSMLHRMTLMNKSSARPAVVSRCVDILKTTTVVRRRCLISFLLADQETILDTRTNRVTFNSNRRISYRDATQKYCNALRTIETVAPSTAGTVVSLNGSATTSSIVQVLLTTSSSLSVPNGGPTSVTATASLPQEQLHPIFVCESPVDYLVTAHICLAVEALWTIGFQLKDGRRISAGSSQEATIRMDDDVTNCFFLLSRCTTHQRPWDLLQRAFAIDRRVRSKLLEYSARMQQARTKAFLQLFAQVQPRHISKAYGFAELVLHINDFVCSLTPVTLLGSIRDAVRGASSLHSTEMLKPTTRQLRSHFFSVKQVILQLASFENDLRLMYDPSISSASRDDGEESMNVWDDASGAASTDSSLLNALAVTRHQRERHRASYATYHHQYVNAIVATFELIIDSFRSHAFQRTLDEPMRLLLNHGLVTCSQLLLRLLRRTAGSASIAAQKRAQTYQVLDDSRGLDARLCYASATVSSFIATLLISDARHNFLQDIARHAIHTLLSETHLFVHSIVALLAQNSSMYVSASEATTRRGLESTQKSGAAASGRPYGDTTLTQALIRVASSTSTVCRKRLGFTRTTTSTTTVTKSGESAGNGSPVADVITVFEALVTLAHSATLARQTPLPGQTVHLLILQLQRDLTTHTLSLVAATPSVTANSIVWLQQELGELEARIAQDLKNAHTERSQLERLSSSVMKSTPVAPAPPLGDTSVGQGSATMTVEEPTRRESGGRGDNSTEQLVIITADSKYLQAKVQTLEALKQLAFALPSDTLKRLVAAAAQKHQSENISRRRGSNKSNEDDDEVLDVSSLISTELFEPQISGGEPEVSSVAFHVVASASPEEALESFYAFQDSTAKRIRLANTSSRRNALAEEVLIELISIIKRFGFVTLCHLRPLRVADFLRAIHLAKRLPVSDALCAEIAHQLREHVNTLPERRARTSALVSSYVEFHSQATRDQHQDPTSYIATVTSSFGALDVTRFQSVDDVAVLEALASRGEQPPEITWVCEPSDRSKDDGGSQRHRIALKFPSCPTRAIETTGESRHNDILPLPVLFALLHELRRLEAGPGAAALTHELATYFHSEFLLTLWRVGPRSTLFEVGHLLSLEMHADDAQWWSHRVPIGAYPLQPQPPSDSGGNPVATRRWAETRVVQNVLIFQAVSTRLALCMLRHKVGGVTEYLSYQAALNKKMRRLRHTVLQERTERARARYKRLTDPEVVSTHVFDVLLTSLRQVATKLLMFGDSATNAALSVHGRSSEASAESTRVEQQHATEIRAMAAKSVADAAMMLTHDILPSTVRKALVAPLSAFVCLPRVNVAGSRVTTQPSSAASLLDMQHKQQTPLSDDIARYIQCPTLYDTFSLTFLSDVCPKLVEGCDPNFTATVASVLDVRLSTVPQTPISTILQSTCCLVNSTARRSQLLVTLLHRLAEFITLHAVLDPTHTTTPPSMPNAVEAVPVSPPLLVAEEDIALFLATVLRADVRMPPATLAALLRTVMSARRDIFGDAPIGGWTKTQLNVQREAARQLRRKPAPEVKLVSREVTVLGASDGAAAVGGESASDSRVQSNDDSSRCTNEAENAEVDPLLEEGFANYSLDGSSPLDAQLRSSHRAAIANLNFPVERLMMLMLSYAGRTRLKRDERLEALGLINAAAAERQERLTNFLTRPPVSAKDGGIPADLLQLQFSNPNHYAVNVVHAEFAVRKIIHSAVRRTGVAQAPHTLADLVDLLHEIEDRWYTYNVQDGMLSATLRTLTDWALLRVEDAGCEGVEDRNQFVTPSGRLFGDVALNLVRQARRKKEARKALYDKMQQTRQWRVKVR